MLREELQQIVDSTSGERQASDFLAAHPEIVRWAFCRTGGHSTYVVKEFPFGNRHRADFAVPMSYSGAWEVHMVELEPPNDKVINKDGTPSRRFNKAISQVHDWASYIKQNPYEVRRDLSDWCVNHDLLGIYGEYGPPSNDTGDYLRDPETFIRYYYHIVIGRRNAIGKEQRRRMNQYSQDVLLRVCTYGRFLDIARNVETHQLDPNARVCLTDAEEEP